MNDATSPVPARHLLLELAAVLAALVHNRLAACVESRAASHPSRRNADAR